jgi:membrane dipeptidase
MKKRYWIPLIVLAVAAIGFFGFAPGYIEGRFNRVVSTAPAPEIGPKETIDPKVAAEDARRNQVKSGALIPISDAAKKLHATLTIVDLHSDTLLWQRDINVRADRGHVDVPRLDDGNVALQVLSSVTKTPRGLNYNSNPSDSDSLTPLLIAQKQPVRTWNSLLQRSLWHGEKLDRAVSEAAGKLIKVDTASQLDALISNRRTPKRAIGALLSIEGLQNLEGNIKNLDVLHKAGFRMAGLTHFFDNEVAGSMHGVKKGGLTPLGRQVVQRMEALGMIVDITHCSRACVADILAMARRPVVASHGGVKATCDNNRNLTDDEIRGIARTGGIIGIGYWDGAICDRSPRSVAKAMKHVRDLVGIEHVALGSDYDGAVTVGFDTSQLVQVTQALIDAGFSEGEIRAAMGENAIRVIQRGIQALPMAVAEPAPF